MCVVRQEVALVFLSAHLVMLTIIWSVALHVYDRVITLGQEIDFIWRRKNPKLIVPVLYLTMHICASLYFLATILQITPLTCQVSNAPPHIVF